jgi:Lhr-like helicase
MGQETLDGDDLSELRAEYNRKVNKELPERAQSSDGWPVHLDHCFGRIVLDNLFADEWYSHVDGRPAYEHLARNELQEAIEIADRMLEEGRPAVEELNRNSLRWRDQLD